jgi:cell division protein FtsL
MLGFKNKTSETADAEKDAAKKNPKPKRSRFVKLLTIFAVAALVVYSGVTIISQQAQIAQLRKESDAINKPPPSSSMMNTQGCSVLTMRRNIWRR